jgi:hypothetical protein
VSTDFLLIFLLVNRISAYPSQKCEILSYLVIKFRSSAIKILISFNKLRNDIFWHGMCYINIQILLEDPMMNPTATELALINCFIIVLIILDGIIKIESTKLNYFDPI